MIPAAEREQAVAAYLNGASLNSIGGYFGVPPKTVADWVWDAGHELRPVRGAGRSQERDLETRKRAVKAYLAGERARVVAERFGVHPNTVARWIKAGGNEMRPRRYPHEKDGETRRLAVEAYLGGDGLDAVARRFRVCRTTVHRWVHSAGHKTRSPDFLGRIGEGTRREAIAAYLGGATLREAGRRIGVHSSTVSKWVKAAGHEVRSSPPPGFNVRDAETQRHAIDAYLAGGDRKAVAERFGATPGTISAWVRAAGHEMRAVDRHKLSREHRQRAVQSYPDGASSVEVGQWFGAHRTTVANWVKAAGHKMRPAIPRRTRKTRPKIRAGTVAPEVARAQYG